jgi:Nuclease-related domain
MAGEQIVAAGLGRVLGDDWTLLRGYRNRRGEIDHLLLGGQGLIAIEVKHRNATVHCDGDDWWFDKYDRYGNLVEQGRLCDRRERSPSVQLNEPASLLEGFLRSRGYPVSIQRVVLFTHPRSVLGSCRNPTVRIATSTDYVIDLLSGSPPALEAGQLARLEQLIVRDHRFHEARRSR